MPHRELTMVHLGEMQVESALFFETPEELYARVFRTLKPRTPLPQITVRFRRYANANARIRLNAGQLLVDISDLLEERSGTDSRSAGEHSDE